MKAALERTVPILFSLLFFVLTFSKAIVSILLVLLLLAGMLTADRSAWRRTLRSPVLWWPTAFVTWHLVSLLWSENLAFGFFDLQIKVLLVVISLVVLLHEPFLRSRGSRLFLAFYSGLAFSVAVLLVYAFMRHRETGSWSPFFYTGFSNFMHPSYLACYLDVAVLLLLTGASGLNVLSGAIKWSLIVLFSVAVVLLNSKAGIIGWCLVTLVLMLWKSVRERSLSALFAAVLFPVLMWTALRLVAPATGDRMADLQKAVGASETVSNPQASSAVRIAVWRTTWQLIRSQPLLGTGAGDIKDELIAAYAAEGASFSAEHRFNAHNQFLQTWLATGIIGLLLLLGTLFFPTLQYRLYPEPAWVLFIVLSAFNMAVESLLERQDGVVFFALFYSVFLIRFAHSRHSGDL